MKKGKAAFLVIITIIFLSVIPVSYAAPFRVDYNYGIQMPDDLTLTAKYNSWVSWYVTASGANGYKRIKYPEGLPCGGADATSSQGLGYAMLLAAWCGDQLLFNDLWNYKTTVSPRLAMMASCVGSGGAVIDQNSASDADADIAMALVHAHRRWGSGGAINYGMLAVTEINKIASNDVCPSTYNLYPGNYCSCVSNDNTYPSYFTPAWYTIFGEHTGNAAFWNSVKAKAYAMLSSSRYAATGLDTEQITYAGAAVSNIDGYNSSRIPWRYSLDYVWHGNMESLAQITLISGFFSGKAADACSSYYTNGTCDDSAHEGHRTGPAGTSMMIAGKSAELSSYYAEAGSLFDTPVNFYNSTMALLSLLQMSGNCPREFGTTPTPCCMEETCGCGDIFEDGTDGDDQNNWGGQWYTYYDRGPVNYGSSYVVPCPVSFYTQAAMTPVPFYMQSPGLSLTPGGNSVYAARMTGYVTTAFTYGFMGMGTGTNKDSGRMTFTAVDCSMYTGVQFLMKASKNTDMYNFIVQCPKSVTNTGGNDWKFTFTPQMYTTKITIPFTSLTQAVGWGIPTSRDLVIQNLTDLRWETNGQPKTYIDLWIDDIGFYPAKPPTPTATYCIGEKLDPFEDNNNLNEFGGFWYTYQSASSVISPLIGATYTAAAPGANSSFYAGRINGHIYNQTGEFAGMGSNMNAEAAARNMSIFVGVSFWAKGDGNWYSVKLKAAAPVSTGGNEYKYTFKPLTESWSQFTIPFAIFTQESGWGLYVPLVTVLSNLKELQFETKGIGHSFDLWVDDIVFNCSCFWTPTITPTITETGTPTQTFTDTPTASITPTVTETGTPTSTSTDTPTLTATETQPTASITPSVTVTDTPLPTFTGTAVNTASQTRTATLAPTPTRTPAATATAVSAVFELHSAFTYPNPSNGYAVKFRYLHGGHIKEVKIKVFTYDGRKIAEIHDADKAAGESETAWRIQSRIGNGMYYYILELYGDGGQVIRKTDVFAVLNNLLK